MRLGKRLAVAASLVFHALLNVAPVHGQEAPAPLPRRLDVIAADSRGREVANLTAADFAVVQDGASQPIASTEFVREPGRVVGIFLDEFHITAGTSAERARESLLALVRTRLTADDRIAVLKPLDSLLAIGWSDRDAAAKIIEGFEGRAGDYAPRTDFERNFLAGAPARIEAARNQIVLSALNALAIHLGTASPGRKTLLAVTGGLPRRSRVRGDEPLPTLDSVIRSANRNRVAVYPIDLTDGAPADDDAARNALRTLANDTTGRVLTVGADLVPGLGTMLADASGYYVVTLQPAAQKPDDRFHSVDVATTRKGVALRSRRGYWAEAPAAALSTRAGGDSVLRLRVASRISPLVRPWFGMSPGQNGATRVSFVWEPAPRVPGDRSRAPMPARVALNVAREDTGETVFEGAVLPSNGAIDVADADDTRATFELAPGKLRVSMSIQDAASQQLDTDVRELTVGGFPGRLTLGTLQVLRARNAREFRLVAASKEGAPVVARQFSRSERLLIRVPADSRGNVPEVSARLVSRFGAARELTVDPWPESTGYQVDVPLAGLAAGEYVVEVAATNEDGTARDSVTFRVTP